jgi:ribosomal protein S8
MKKSTIRFLAALKNATLIKKESLTVKASIQVISLASAFYSKGLIQSFYISKEMKVVRVFLRYTIFGNPFSNMKIFSTATKDFTYSHHEICRVTLKRKMLLFSTSVGILNMFECKKLKKGGKLYLSFF